MGASLEYYDGSFYVFGYSIYNVMLGMETGTELFRYDIDKEIWEIVQVSGYVPAMRLNHLSCIYNEEMYIFYGIITESTYEHNTIYKFTFKTKTWSFVGFGNLKGLISGAKVLQGNFLYLMFGRDSTEVFNSVTKIDLSVQPLEFEVIVENWLAPSERVGHCSFVVNRKMYIFGGSNGATNGAGTEVEVLYNDLWAFDMDLQTWSSINMLGSGPSPRKSFGCSKTQGDVVAVFGGMGESGVLNDLYYFHEPELYWYKVTSDNDGPTARYLSCLAYYSNLLFIIGGKNKDKAFGDIWIYDFATNQFELSEAKILIPEVYTLTNLFDCKCWIESKDLSSYSLLIIGGSDFNSYPNQKLLNYTFINKTFIKSYKQLGVFQEQSIIGSETLVVITDKYIIRLGGSIYSLILLPSIFVYYRETGNYKLIPTRYQFEFWGHSGVHFADSIYVFGGGGSNEVYKSYRKISNNLIKISFHVGDGVELECSAGTFNETCQPCMAGTYFDKGVCVNCPKGRINNLLSCTSINQCTPCAENYYNDQEGSNSCLQCPSGTTCPIGSAYPKPGYHLPSNSSVQPSAYKSESGSFDNLTTELWYIFLGISVLIFILSLCFHEVWNKLRLIDMFVSYHGNELGVPVIHRKTSFGGLFTIFFSFACILTIITGFLEYTLNNIDEIRALVPVITLTEDISAKNLEINSTFYIYGGDCVVDFKCHPLIEFQDFGFYYTNKSVVCGRANENCFIHAKYENVKLEQKNSEIRLSLREKFSFASALTVNMTSSSSIPNEISSIFTAIEPPKSKLFRGTKPSKIYYKFTPSVKEI